MALDDPQEDLDQTICFCHCVNRGKLKDVIAAGARTLGEIQKQTSASTGCGGCEFEVTEILAAELAQLARPVGSR